MPEDKTEKIKELMHKHEKIRNIAIAAHIDHGKTTFTDSLIAGAGMISEELAGKLLVMDFHEDEKERGITIDAANVSMVHEFENEEYLINLIDTPGHVDFGGDVTRAMRAVDGCIVLVCASEGVMPQTETVLRQALKERVKPVLFINKVDRLIREIKLTPAEMQQRFIKIIEDVNGLIDKIAPEEFKDKWKVNVQKGSVAFGSAVHKWALSFPYMEKHKISFKEVIDAYQSGQEEYKKLAKKAPLHKIILNMVIRHHPNPKEAQKYRIPKIWHGDLDSEVGKSLLSCDENGEIAFVCTKVVIDKHAGEVAAGRLFSGTISQGDEVYMNLAKKPTRIQQVSVYKGPHRVQLDKVIAGNIIGITGLRGIYAGETVSKNPIDPFEAIKHIFEPVVTKSIEAKKAADLPKLVEVLKQVSKEDPSITIQINEETGENLMMGMGELHLEVIENRIRTEKGLDVKTSEPIVVYRETVLKDSPVVEGRSPNKHNSFFIAVEPLEDEVYKLIKSGEVSEGRKKKKDEDMSKKLSGAGISNNEIKQYKHIYKGNVFLDCTRGEVHIGEVLDMVLDAFEQVVNAGPLAREPCMKLKVSLVDTKLHEDAIHRGPAQVYPAVRNALYEAMKRANTSLFEPIQTYLIEVPINFMSEITKLVSSKRGQLLDIREERGQSHITAKLPVMEMIGWSSDLRGATEGRGVSSLQEQNFEKMPKELQEVAIKEIRDRKGLQENQ